MRIAVDAMGGDRGPAVVMRGVLEAAARSSATFILVGNTQTLQAERERLHVALPANVQLEAASQVVEMSDQPTSAIRRKPDASIVVAARMVKEGRASALVTMGNTGAAMAVSLLTLGRIQGIDRPAIAIPLPSEPGRTVVLLDAGATVDSDASNLFEYALMGSVYAEEVVGVPRPRVGLLSNGEEPGKGTEVVKRAHSLFSQLGPEECPFHFIGNVEGRDIFRGNVDVAVCDGFTGNVVLKTGEGVAEMVLGLIKAELSRHIWMRTLTIPFVPALRRLKSRVDYSERGGAPLLGVNGVCIIGHGRSNERAVANACLAAERAIRHNVVEVIRRRVCQAPALPAPC